MAKTYLFYDLETSGLNKCFDQVLQFAAIRTDEDFNELERIEKFVTVSPDVIPTPMAMLTHQIRLETLAAKGRPELPVIREIHRELNTPGTISLGYNTLGFDDEFLRFSFYRNCLPAYTHQYANQCSRMDIFPLTMMYHLYEPGVIEWPEVEGKISLKLENLNKANQLATGQAHDAMVDVIATVELAKKLRQSEKMWQYCTGFFDKHTEAKRLSQLGTGLSLAHRDYAEGIMCLGKLGAKNHFQSPVLCLGQHKHYKNQSLWLRLDDEKIFDATVDNFEEQTWVITKKAGEVGFVLPCKERYLSTLTEPAQAMRQESLQFLAQHPKLLAMIGDHYQDYTYPVLDNVDVQARLYQDSFLAQDEARWCQRFVSKPSADALACAPSGRCHELGLRALGRLDSSQLESAEQEEFAQYVADIYSEGSKPALDFRGEAALNLDGFYQEIAKLNELNPQQVKLLQSLEAFVDERKIKQLA